MKSILLRLITLLLLTTALASCGPFRYERADVKDSPINDADMRKRNIEQGRGFTIPIGKNSGGGNFSFANANELWRATLDVLDFTPLSNVDYGGGMIVTDWFSDDASNEEIKIAVRFLTNEIRSDALKIIIHKKICTSYNDCKITSIDNSTNNEIKFSILRKAAELQKLDLIKTKEKNSDVKLPKNF